MRALGFIFAWLLMVGAMAYGASLIHFVDIPSVLVTVAAGHAVAAGVYGRDAFGVMLPPTGKSLGARAIRITQGIDRFYILAGWLGVLIGIVHMALVFEELDATNFGPSLAVCVLPVFYAYLMRFGLWAPLAAYYEDVLAEG